ncbi:uncharacterized protein PHALS_13419 [Plasmopara halstedii]|uniref:Uncharacterized protein n=1 Tax=Plasmopara halstedii TaxID=4781 RepID=A0A0P1APT3_PLAHL|nr:uncharacterized protein PHALS_13419 [Plasmopara halstedii]CEG43206.1 hypothetical protein PHALS_13419 [Plasmopara halstedii]|eukprot:XP_024579575.1 hypothetical protein PHALS_13419 [Plasmopara halstedii]
MDTHSAELTAPADDHAPAMACCEVGRCLRLANIVHNFSGTSISLDELASGLRFINSVNGGVKQVAANYTALATPAISSQRRSHLCIPHMDSRSDLFLLLLFAEALSHNNTVHTSKSSTVWQRIFVLKSSKRISVICIVLLLEMKARLIK